MKAGSDLIIDIPKFETISEGYWGLKTHTKFMIVTKGLNIPMLDSDSEFTVWRRYSDFEWFHSFMNNQDDYKGLVLPSLPEKSYFSRNDEAFVESRRHDLINYLHSLANHKVVKNSRLFHMFLTIENEDEFNQLKAQEGTLGSKLYEYAQQIMSMDTDYLVANIGQYFDSQEPDDYALPALIRSRVEALLEYEDHLSKILKNIKEKIDLNDEISESMSQVALSLEKFRLNSEATELDKLFSLGGIIEEEEMEDLDNIAFSRNDSRGNDLNLDEFDKISRVPFKKNFFPSLKECSRITWDINENWKNLYRNLKVQLAKIHGVKDAMDRRTSAISKYKANSSLIKKKKLKQETNYNYLSMYAEIEALEKENISLNDKIVKINKNLSDDLTELSITETIESEVAKFVTKYKQDVDSGSADILNVEKVLKVSI